MNDAALAGQHDYHVFGLRVRSELALPELFPSDNQAEPDVTIRTGAVAPPATREPGLHVQNGALLLVVPHVARFRIEQGTAITVEPENNVPDRNVRVYLLGSAMGAILHQRGLLPLHANAVEIDGNAIAFMAPSGGGKSTLAAWFHDHGYRVIADDVCVVGFDPTANPYAAPGLPRLRLWAQALELMGREAATYPRSYVGPDQVDKFDVAIDRAGAAQSQVRLAALYVLERGEEPAIERLNGVEAADAVFANTYRGAYLSAINGHKRHWESAVRLVRSTPVFLAVRKWNLAELDEQCSHLLEHARGTVTRLEAGECEST